MVRLTASLQMVDLTIEGSNLRLIGLRKLLAG